MKEFKFYFEIIFLKDIKEKRETKETIKEEKSPISKNLNVQELKIENTQQKLQQPKEA